MSTDETLIKLTTEAIEKLDHAMSEMFKLSKSDRYGSFDIGALGRSIGLIREFQNPIFERNPDLRPPPPEDYVPDPELTKEQAVLVNELNESDKKQMDEIILSYACQHWRKVAFIVGKTMMDQKEKFTGIPDVYYAQRIQRLVRKGKLESQGNLNYMRYSEIRLPSKGAGATEI